MEVYKLAKNSTVDPNEKIDLDCVIRENCKKHPEIQFHSGVDVHNLYKRKQRPQYSDDDEDEAEPHTKQSKEDDESTSNDEEYYYNGPVVDVIDD